MEWTICKSEADLPRRDCFITFVMKGNDMTVSHLNAETGWLFWNRDKSDGAVVCNSELVLIADIDRFIEIPSPIHL
jgi:hypothetical protein